MAGHLQDRSIYSPENDIHSPTVTLQSVFMIAGLAASEKRDVMTIDVEGAYLHCPIKEDVYMRLDKHVSKLLVEIDSTYEQFVTRDGTIIVKLDKALYGLVESARLFYEHLTGSLIKLGFAVNPYDVCVFNRLSEEGVQPTVCFHVDDLLVTCADANMNDRLAHELNEVYPNLKVHRGDVHDYGTNF